MAYFKPSVLRDLLDYDPETGLFTWKKRTTRYFQGRKRPASVLRDIWNTKYAGKQALTSIDDYGYMSGAVLGKKVRAHRVAWSIYHNQICPQFIDHKNGVRTDNKISNLRAATRAQNNVNKRKQSNAKSRFLGVFRDSPASGGKGWRVQIKPSGEKVIHVGHFSCEVEAAKAYDRAAIRHHGEFARLNFPMEAGQ